MSTQQFYKYFKEQNATSLNNILETETNMETHSNGRVEGPLDYPNNKLKANKSPGFDNILVIVDTTAAPVLCIVGQ